MKRDGNTVQDYYRAWDKFDVDKELEKIDTQQEKPKQGFNQGQQGLEKAKIKLEVKKGTRLPPGRFLTEEETKQYDDLTDQVFEKVEDIKKDTIQKQELNEQIQSQIDKAIQETKQKEDELKRVEQEKQEMLAKIKEMEKLLKQG